MDTSQRLPGISGAALKWFALITMFIDHFGASLLLRYLQLHGATAPVYNAYIIIRLIGRPAFPIYCFLLIEGFLRTRSRLRYALRLALFALLSELPFDYALHGSLFNWSYQNVYFTLLLGLCTVWALEKLLAYAKASAALWQRLAAAAAVLAAVGLSCLVADKLLRCDYGMHGILTIVVMYVACRLGGWLSFALGASVLVLFQPIELPALLGVVPVRLYNGTRGRQPKYLFYAFYPVHLLLLGLACTALGI